MCRGFRGQREQTEAAIAAAQAELPAANEQVAAAQVVLDNEKKELVNDRVAEYAASDGFIARHEALSTYLSGNATAQLLRWSLTAVLVLIDLLVLMFKVLGAETLHDQRTKVDRRIARQRLDSKSLGPAMN